MARDLDTRVRNAAEAVLTDQEQVEAQGGCWAVQCPTKVPLLFRGRHRYHVALTNRRVLVFARRRGGPDAADLVLGKRYHAYEVEKVRRGFPMFQVRLRAANGSRLIFEFQRKQRAVARALVGHLEAEASGAADTHIRPMAALLETVAAPAPASTATATATATATTRPASDPVADATAADVAPEAPRQRRKRFRRSPKPETPESGATEPETFESGATEPPVSESGTPASEPAPDAGTPPAESKRSRKERKRLARNAEAQLDTPLDVAAPERDAAAFWDPPA